MTLHALRDKPAPALARALAEFETQFTYPLGPGRTFSISHGDDYPRFFRRRARRHRLSWKSRGRVSGALGVAVRPLQLPCGKQQNVAYFGDLKVGAAARRGFVFLRLAWAAHSWLKGKAGVGYGVVMDGTRDTPDRYSGLLGIPAVRVLGKILIWQFQCTDKDRRPEDECFLTTPEQVAEDYQRFSLGRYACRRPAAERLEMPLVWLRHPNGTACGLVEDTRRAKRLHAHDGSELRSAHLSFFAFHDPAAGADLLQRALRFAAPCRPSRLVCRARTSRCAISRTRPWPRGKGSCTGHCLWPRPGRRRVEHQQRRDLIEESQMSGRARTSNTTSRPGSRQNRHPGQSLFSGS